MRLITFEVGGAKRAGAVIDNGVVELSARMGVRSVRQLIAEDRVVEAETITSSASPDYRLDQVKLGLPIEDPAKILCIGVNYMNRNAEYKDGSEAPKYPSVFMRTPLSLAPHGEPVVIPRESSQLDYEGEIVLVIGKVGRRISQAEAMKHVAGLTIMNEGTVFDWLRHGKFNVTQGKNFDRSGSMGPWIETSIEALDVDGLRTETRVNGELRQSDTTASLVFPFRRIIEYLSTFCTLLPGDLISTGTPTGAGARLDPPQWLREGDVVEVTVENVGTLRNTVVRE
jgi:2-keto-4-pentenoate hydratase/2-oxohepta-3-ene-1,7-dioic acid hydratase in catechol pathway